MCSYTYICDKSWRRICKKPGPSENVLAEKQCQWTNEYIYFTTEKLGTESNNTEVAVTNSIEMASVDDKQVDQEEASAVITEPIE